MIRKTTVALAAIATLALLVAPASDAAAKGFQGPKGISNGKGPGPTVHPKGPQNWGSPKFPKGPKGPGNLGQPKYGKLGGHHHHGHHGHWGYGVARIGVGIIANSVQEPDCYRVITRSGRVKTVCTY